MIKNRFFLRPISCVVILFSVINSSMRALPARAASPTSSVVIGEVAWAGSSLSTADEWLELWNVGDAPVSLAGWTLRGASADPLPFPADAVIQPHDLYLVSNYASGDAKSVLATTTHLVTTVVALSNSALKIELLDASGNVVDTAGTGGAPLAGVSLPVKTTMIRTDATLDGITATAWTNATTTLGMKPGIPDLGTPGVCDSCGVVAAPDPITPTPPPADIVETTTSTLDVVTDAATTIGNLASDTSTVEVTTSTADATTSDATTDTPDPLQPTAYSLPTPTPPPKPNYNMLRLNEVAPYPASGKEWIEIATLDASQAINLKGCTVNDSTGKIFTIGDVTLDPLVSRYAVVALSSSKLNNGGDGASLYAPDGRLLDVMKYDTTKKGETWVRFPDLIGNWQKTTSPTPEMVNALTMATVTTTTKAAVPKTTTAKTSASSTSAAIPKTILDALTNEVLPDEPTDDTSLNLDKIDGEELLAADDAETNIIEKTTTTKKKTTTKASASTKPIHSINFDMLTDETLSDVRVRLTGRVGSLPGLVAAHKFVLQNPDGRGLLVSIPTKQRLPFFGSDVTVVGSLTLDDKGAASLKIGTRDPWSKLPTSTETVVPRVVDLLAPSGEDAWSLANVTGTVTDVKTGTVHLDLGDAEIDIVIKPLVKYRVKRLSVGDVLAVTGLLDLTHDDPKLLPRSADEITLVSHAAPKVAVAAEVKPPEGPTLPGWAPFGAAGGAVVVTEGAKRLHKRRKMKALEKK